MEFADILGFLGVTILLIAFFLNLKGYIDTDSKIYIILNLLGAGIACIASIMINYAPFIILEGTWTIVSAVQLVKVCKKKS